MHAPVNFLKTLEFFNHIMYSPFLFLFCPTSDVLSMATAVGDFTAPDCRFINIKKGQMVYVYSKLIPEEGTGVFWSGSVCAYVIHVI